MSPFSASRPRIRALSLTAISFLLVSISLTWASRQQAGSPSFKSARNYSSRSLFADKGVITPAAATITVNSLSDVANGSDGLCTLREAIQAAHANTASGAVAGECAAGTSQTDTINFSVTGTIDLATILPPIASAMNISGPDAALLTVRRSTAPGTPNFRIFTVFSGVTATISGLTITNGRSADGVVPTSGSFGKSGDLGGGIMNSGVLTLTNITINGNRTGDGSLPPAASFGTGSNFGGSGGSGGGIYSSGSLTMSNVTVSNNTTGNGVSASFGGEGGRGGGIFIDSGTLTMTSCLLSGNVTGTGAISTSGGSGSGGEGGGIGIRVGTITITNTSVINNTTGTSQVASPSERGAGGGGAGIMIDSGAGETGAVTVINCTIGGNHTGDGNGFAGQAGRGAGLNNVSSSNLTIIGSTISGNTTGNGLNGGEAGVGAGLVNTNSAITKIINSTISGNSLGTSGFANGAGIWNSSKLFLTNSTVVLNTGNGLNGGGIQQFNNSSSATLRNSIVALNTGYDLAGGTYNSQGHNLIGNADNTTGFSSGIGDQFGTAASPLNPQLGPLINNGGSTQTHALLSNSTALDAGDNCVTDAAHCGDANIPQLTTDQRGAGFSRLVDGPDANTTATVDIGAYETQGTLASIPDTTTLEDTQVAVPFDGGDTSAINSVTATSDNASVVPNDAPHLSAAVMGATVVVTINPAANASGTANITVTVNRTGGPENKTFLLTVTPVNDAPTFTIGPDQTIDEDASAQTVNGWASSISPGAPDEAPQILTFNITGNTNSALFSVAPAISSNGTLTYTPAANANGSATITISLKDNGGTANGGVDTSASQTLTITVNSVNDVPSFTKGNDLTVNEDTGVHTIFWATNISAGAANESAQTLTFQVVNNTNPSLFSVQPSVNSGSGNVNFTSATNASGSATITVNLKDNGGTANGGVDTSQPQSFSITVNPVNDAPSFTKGANQTVVNNAGPQTVANWATNILAGPADESGQTVTFQITNNTRPGIFSVLPAINSNGTLTYTANPNSGGTATITINLKDNGGTANGGADTSATQNFNIVITPVGGFFNFTETDVVVNENQGSRTIFVLRSGDSSRPVTVDYATSGNNGLPCSTANGVATPKCDFTAALGTLSFASGEVSKTVVILISQDSFVEGSELFNITLSNPTGGSAIGSSGGTANIVISDDATEPPTNVIDDPNVFVRMHYHDFLNREGDQSGLDFWTGQMTNCGNSDLLVCRVNVSGAFFLSIEFQQTGYLVERIYKTGYGDATGTSTIGGSHQIFVPTVRANEFLADTQRVGRGVVVGQNGWETVLEKNKQDYALEFVQTSRFITAFPTSMTPTQFVDKLNQNAGNVLDQNERTTTISLFGSDADTTNVIARSQALRQVAEDPDLFNAEANRAFVLTEYIGYLRRNPNDAPESTLDYTGYDFWLQKLNQFNGNYINAEMVKAFISSSEYRQRFGNQ